MPPKYKLSDEDKKIIIDKYNSGLSAEKVAELFNVSDSTIYRILTKENIKKRDKGFQKGNTIWLGKHLSIEAKEKISKANSGRIVDEKTKDKISNSLKGRILSKGHKLKIGLASKKTWENQNSVYHTKEYKQKRQNIVFGGKYWKGKTHKLSTIQKMEDACVSTKNYNWKGGIIKDHCGYVCQQVKNHHFSNRRSGYKVRYGYMLQHRLVMEEWLRKNEPNSEFLVEVNDKKYLNPKCIIHHIDFDKGNNIIENLYIFKGHKEHTQYHNILRWAVIKMVNENAEV